MNATTSTHFVSTIATGENWRDISKKILEQLESVKTDGFRPNVGFLYVTESLAADAGSIITLFKSVTGIEHWTGCVALGVCGNGIEYMNVPAISVLAGQVEKDHVRGFHAAGPNFKKLHNELEPWLNTHDPMLVVVHADPFVDSHPAAALEEIDEMVGGFMVGGLSSSRKESAIFSKEAMPGGISGLVFSQDVLVATALSQGYTPMGSLHEISRTDDHVIGYLDGRMPFEVFSEDMRTMAEQRLGYKPLDAIIKGDLQPDLSNILSGAVHVAFPVAGSDQKDYLVRNIMAIDPDTGIMAVGEVIEDGMKMMFVHRDDETVRNDLASTLVTLHKRVLHERGSFTPKAALYISCVARMSVPFAGGDKAGGEMALLREVLGDIPVAGFYAGGEVSNNRLYGYTGLLTLFL